MTHCGLSRRTPGGFVAGAHAFLHRLKEELDGTALTDWLARVGAVRGLNPAAEQERPLQ